MSDSEYDDDSSQDNQVNEAMKVFLRLRPMNKLETSRRSKNCVDLPEDDPRCITVDSPLEGEYDFFFDRVFEEYASQEEVYQSSIAPVPAKLLEGYNCTVIAFGQTGSGKSHTMMGMNGGADGLLALTHPQAQDEEPPIANSEAQGMIPRTAHHVFQQIQASPATTEYTIRCSYVEIYLEKILDLLNPSGDTKLRIVEDLQGDEAAGVGDVATTNVRIAGAAELCCFDEADVYGLLARGNACRTMSSTEMNTDSSRSHAIFIMKVEQHDTTTGVVLTSELHMIDLAGSEMASNQGASAAQRDASAVQMEAKMINKSLTALQNCIRAQLENQQGAKHPVAAMSKQSKLTRFLRPSFGGNCMTWLILTASPSSYNIGETISTIRFGQRVKRIENPAVVNVDYSREVYQKRLKESEQQRKAQVAVLKAVASECKKLKEEALKGSAEEEVHDGPLWDTIEDLLSSEDAGNLDFKALVQGRTNVSDDESVSSAQAAADELEKARREIEKLREQLESISQAKDDSDNQLSELESEVAVLRSQNEHLIADKTKDLEELINAKNELQIMSQRKIEVEHNFRTSQFRENEAIVFLRTFRRFYKNVLRDRAAHGSGSMKDITKEISDKVPGALDLGELVDADALLLEAGLIEEHEIRDEKSAPIYVPSRAALIRSATNAKKAVKAMEELEEKEFAKESTEVLAAAKGEMSGQSASDGPVSKRASFVRRGSSAIRRSSVTSVEKPTAEETSTMSGDEEEPDGEFTVENSEKAPGAGADAGAGSSPPIDQTEGASAQAGSLWDESGMAITRRQQLLGTPSGRFSLMQGKNTERDLADLADKCIKLEQELKEERATVDMLSGRAGGVNKKKLAQEAIQLRQQIETKTQNLMAIAWKMNELNLINKSYNEKMVNREQHVIYLEENYVELQNRNRMIIEQQQEAERKLRDELDSVQKVLGGMSVSLWQYNEEKPTKERSVASRIRVLIRGGNKLSLMDGEMPKRRMSDADSEPSLDLAFERDIPIIEKVDSSTQTDELKLEDAQVQTEPEEKVDVCIQTDEVPREDSGTMTEEALGVEEFADKASAAGPVVAIGVPGATSIDDQSEESNSDNELEDTCMGRRATAGAFIAPAGTAGAVISSQTDDIQNSDSYSDDNTDGAAVDLVAVDAADGHSASDTVAVSRRVTVKDSRDEAEEKTKQSADASSLVDRAAASVAVPQVAGAGVNAPVDGESDQGQCRDMDSDDDIEAITGDLAAVGVVPQIVAIDSYENMVESLEDDVADRTPSVAGKALAGISNAAVVAAAASVTSQVETEKTREAKPTADQKSKDEKGDTFKARNLFASTVFSVLNLGSSDRKEEMKTKGTSVEDDGSEIESYRGDGHSLSKHLARNTENQATSRDEWAAARDDFDSIFEETAQAVNTSSLRRKPAIIEDREPDKFASEFKAIAAKIGHQTEDEIVTMGNKSQLVTHEDVPRKPWEKDSAGDNRKPWERSPKKRRDEGSFGESYDITKDSWYANSDDESVGSYRFETHVLNRAQKEEAPRTSTLVKFSDSTIKRDKSTSEDEFDQMMSATQAALGAVEVVDEAEVDNDAPSNDNLSLTSKEEALFTGGRTNSFHPRRSANRPKIKAAVLKEEKKPSRDKSRSDLIRKKSESRRKLGDGDEKKRKKKDEKRKDEKEKKKKKSGKSSRDLMRSKSERHTKRDI